MGKVLVVDDDHQVRALFRLALERAGLTVLEAASGKAAERLHETEPVELAIVDIVMPEKDGLETIMDFRKRFPDTRIIAISGGGRHGPENYLHWAARLGADCVFAKPIDMATLVATVRDLLGHDLGKS